MLLWARCLALFCVRFSCRNAAAVLPLYQSLLFFSFLRALRVRPILRYRSHAFIAPAHVVPALSDAPSLSGTLLLLLQYLTHIWDVQVCGHYFVYSLHRAIVVLSYAHFNCLHVYSYVRLEPFRS